MYINFSNGAGSWYGPEEAADALQAMHASGIAWEQVAHLMEDATREQVALNLAPCSEADFLAEYLRLASADLVIG